MNDQSADFIEKGLANYCEAKRAIVHFENKILEIARSALVRHLSSLSDAMGKPFRGKQPTEHLNKDDLQFTGAWVTVKLDCERPFYALYVGVRWQLEADGTQNVFAAVDFEAATAPIRDRLLMAASALVPPLRFNPEHKDGNEVRTLVELKPKAAADLESLLSEILSEWERLFTVIGGVGAVDAKP
jgi:hypothetical protein